MADLSGKFDDMAHILKKIGLVHLNELLKAEKITPDIISLLSTNEMNQLGVTSRADMMNLRIQCRTFSRLKPGKNHVGCAVEQRNLTFPNQYWNVI